MKKAILILALFFCWAMAASAQEKEHLEFEGVQINGTVEHVLEGLRSKGYKQEKGISRLHGKVMGKKATVTVASTPDGSSVYLILVEFDTKKNWENVRTCYESMKMQLRARHGDPVLYKEEFDSPLAEADPVKALQYNNCRFICHFQAPGGEIILSISKDAIVQCYYVDTSNAVSLY
ncbi:MAG: hypothetical protein IJ151_06140 [Bacteroidales bacterium]|nr:hypothetical protein [Bacteroidales bacterium]